MSYYKERDLKSVILKNGEHFDKADFDVYSKNYQKKPLIIRALKLEIDVIVKTLEGDMVGKVGDYLVEGIEGEFYICHPDIFKKTYDSVRGTK